MTQVVVEWSLVEAQCLRIGWGLGWAVGITLAAMGVAAGADVYLTALRAMLALVGFVLLGWTTGIFLSRFAPTEINETPSVGSKVDRTVGDKDPAFPGPGGSGGDTHPPDLKQSAGAGELIRSGNAA